MLAVSRPCIRFFSFRYRFKVVTERTFIFIVFNAVSQQCIRFFLFRYSFKHVTEWSSIFIVLLAVSRPCMYQIFLIQISI